MRVENTVLKDYKVLNNVLAFVNTVPSLATFSLPNYHSKGLPVKEGYAHFNYHKGVLKVDNFTLNSPEMKILGEGKADLNTNTIEGALTLKTDLGSKLGKRHGRVHSARRRRLGVDHSDAQRKSEDPKIETAIAKEIVTACSTSSNGRWSTCFCGCSTTTRKSRFYSFRSDGESPRSLFSPDTTTKAKRSRTRR